MTICRKCGLAILDGYQFGSQETGYEHVGSCPEVCLACDEQIGPDDSGVPTHTMTGMRYTHRECALREVLGGIGHHIAHEYWCGAPRHDPDGGLTRRQSALLVYRLWELLGEEVVARANRGVSSPASEPEGTLAAQLQEMYPENWQAASDDDEEWATAVVHWAESPEPPEEGPPLPRDQRGPVPGSGAVWGPPRQL